MVILKGALLTVSHVSFEIDANEIQVFDVI